MVCIVCKSSLHCIFKIYVFFYKNITLFERLKKGKCEIKKKKRNLFQKTQTKRIHPCTKVYIGVFRQKENSLRTEE